MSKIKSPRPPKNDITGQTFQNLFVTGMIQDLERKPNGQYFAVCNCHLCGKENFKTLPYNLRRGRTTSCGCRKDQYQKITGENSKQFTGHREIRGKFWTKLKYRSEKKGHEFKLEIEKAWELFELQKGCCALTGLPIFFRKFGQKSTASLDRLDCKKGYEEGNVQWVHKDVNIMRNVFSVDYFVEICKLVVQKKG